MVDNAVMDDCYSRYFAPLLFLFLLLPPVAFSQSAPAVNPGKKAELQQQTQLAADRLQQWYNPQTGLWKPKGWWNAANDVTVLIDFSRQAHSSAYLPVITNTFAVAPKTNKDFLNGWYDDEGWWALAWIDAYDLTGNQEYLRTAAHIFDDMTGGWDNTCGGGIWWTKKRHYKNAIANELFLSVAAHLATRTADSKLRATYVDWAERDWKWFRATGMIERDHLISDGLDEQCHDNHAQKWTYNQGVILGGLAELSRADGSRADIRTARKIAAAAMKKMADRNGILHEPCEPKCSSDGMQFKGIFMRNLAALNAVDPDRRYAAFIAGNAAGILEHDQSADHSLGLVWSGPPDAADAVSQSSALDALVAALKVSGEKQK
jgi:predicted alpha-1,6-mannanase (GH76 family)